MFIKLVVGKSENIRSYIEHWGGGVVIESQINIWIKIFDPELVCEGYFNMNQQYAFRGGFLLQSQCEVLGDEIQSIF